jgi:transcriptional regulator with XRE-family HTH domain
MIKNEREYRITKSQVTKFREALTALGSDTAKGEQELLGVELQEAALRSQLEELEEEVRQYEDLATSKARVIAADSIEELPVALIKARIASGLTQADLARQLGVPEQQVQRYESTEFSGASLTRIRQIADALRVRIKPQIFVDQTPPSLVGMYRKLGEVGVTRSFVERWILSPAMKESVATKGSDFDVVAVASRIGRVFGWGENDLLGDQPLPMDSKVLASVRYKKPKKSDERKVSALTVYAHYLALLALQASAHLKPGRIPQDAHALRKEIERSFGSLGFTQVLQYAWSLGIPVLPLRVAGGLHGAMWRVKGRNVIVLNQGTRSISRWMIDLLHELSHAKDEPESPSKAVVETDDPLVARKDTAKEETSATEFAINVALNGRAEDLFEACVNEAQGKVEWLKRAIPKVAHKERVDLGVLANALAHRLSEQGINWWPTAVALQDDSQDPWSIARNMFLESAKLESLNKIDRALLLQSLSELEE